MNGPLTIRSGQCSQEILNKEGARICAPLNCAQTVDQGVSVQTKLT